jgi:hypothetical protein
MAYIVADGLFTSVNFFIMVLATTLTATTKRTMKRHRANVGLLERSKKRYDDVAFGRNNCKLGDSITKGKDLLEDSSKIKRMRTLRMQQYARAFENSRLCLC